MKKIILSLILTLQINSSIPKEIPPLRNIPIQVTTSVIIPCYHGHFKYLEKLLEEYTKQIVLPNEIVISLSEANLVDQNKIHILEKRKWPFKLIIITSNEQLFAGSNRNIAAQAASGDILICQDADDTPHKQRVQIIKHVFENYQVEHLMHYFSRNQDILKNNYSLDTIFNPRNRKYGATNGNIAITKDVFRKFQWSDKPRGQDSLFNLTMLQNGYPRYVVTVPIYVYRNYLSSHSYVKSLKETNK